ncbi:MAG: hypothetical protein U9Q90_00425 [Campylobacterota bacterium]|nr:hypothetical protein [Campylobacterota bacterium]
MKKTNIVILSAAALLALSGCGNAPESSSEAKTYAKSPKEVWEGSCHKCHGENAEGNTKKKTPPMNDRQAGELELDLYDVKNDGLNQSSGTEHEKMAHNMKKLLEKGWDYDPKAMAVFIEKSFYKMDAPKAAEVPAEAPAEAPAAETPAAEAAPAETPAAEAAPAETPAAH